MPSQRTTRSPRSRPCRSSWLAPVYHMVLNLDSPGFEYPLWLVQVIPAPARFVAGRRMSVVRRAEEEMTIKNGKTCTQKSCACM